MTPPKASAIFKGKSWTVSTLPFQSHLFTETFWPLPPLISPLNSSIILSNNPSDFPLENGGFDNLILNDKKKKNQYKNFIKELAIFKYTQFSAYHRDNLVAFGEALKLLEKKYSKLSLKPGNEQILIDFYNKLILLIEVSMNEKTASQFFTNKFEIDTSLKKKDLTKI